MLFDQNSANCQMLAKTTVLKLKKQNSLRLQPMSMSFLKINFCWGEIARLKGETCEKIGPKVEICPISTYFAGVILQI